MYAADNDDRFPSAANCATRFKAASDRRGFPAPDSNLRCAFAYNRKLTVWMTRLIRTVCFESPRVGMLRRPELFNAHKHCDSDRRRLRTAPVRQLPRSISTICVETVSTLPANQTIPNHRSGSAGIRPISPEQLRQWVTEGR
jgi:hypothetical protein